MAVATVIGTPTWKSAVDNVWNKLSRSRRELAIEVTRSLPLRDPAISKGALFEKNEV